MRWLPVLALLLGACGEPEDTDPPVCPDVCYDAFTVVAVSSSSAPFGFAEISVSFVNEGFTFLCNGGSVRDLSDTIYAVSCDDESFTVEGIAPAEIDVELNGLYPATLKPAYQSAHPSAECTTQCMQAEVEWQLPV